MEKCKNWREAIPLKQALYDLSCAGGLAHVVIDDGNLEDYFIDHCIQDCQGLSEHYDERTREASLNLLIVMKAMSMTQRRKLYNHHIVTLYRPHVPETAISALTPPRIFIW